MTKAQCFKLQGVQQIYNNDMQSIWQSIVNVAWLQARMQTFEGGGGGAGEIKGFYKGGEYLKKNLILRPKLGM